MCGLSEKNFLLPLSRLHSPLLKNHFWWKKIVQKIVTSTFLEFGKVFRFLATKLRQACQNFIVLVRRTFWGETTLMGKRPNFSSFPEFEQTVLRILTRIFGQGGHNRILRAQMKFFFNFWRREMKEKLLLFENCALLSYSDFERKTSLVLLQAWLRQACQKFVDMFRRRLLQINFSEGLLFFPHFQNSSKKFSEFWREYFGRVVTTTFIHVHKYVFGKLFSFRKVQIFLSWFSESQLQMCGLSEKIICYRCQDRILRC